MSILKYFTALLLSFFVFTIVLSCSNNNQKVNQPISVLEQNKKDSVEQVKLKEYALKAFPFCKKKNYNEHICFLINYNIHSGKPRFFIWNFDTQKLEDSGLVSHGCGNSPWGLDVSKENAMMSNAFESHCSSLGKYKISTRAVSEWGIKIKYNLIGLDATNSNAAKRTIVLHSWEMVSDSSIYPKGTPEGWGCPAVSNNFLKALDARLKDNKKPTLLWVFK